MHCKYMGLGQYFLASVLVICTFTIAIPGCDTWQRRLNKDWEYCMEWYRENPVDANSRYKRLVVNMFCKPSAWRTKFPKLKGRAAEVKHLTPALLHAWVNMRDPGNPLHTSIELALQMSLKMDKNIRCPPRKVQAPGWCFCGFYFSGLYIFEPI